MKKGFSAPAPGEGLEIIRQDDAFVAVNKPAGLLVHRSPLDPREERFALQMARNILGRRVYPVHRLDRATSGVLLFALSPGWARQLAAAFAERRVEKGYLAVVRGFTAEEGVIDHPLADLPDRYPCLPRDDGERDAVTAYRRLATAELPVAVGRYPTSRYSLVAAFPRTGRRHQLRRHFKHLFHPIIGDTNYGEGRHNRFFREELGCSRLLLHAAGLTFPHPSTGGMVTLTAPPGGDFASLLGRLGWREAVPPQWSR
ncbi:MAG TPA: pseudouridine synthase [Geobacteraceae bacterium]